MFAAPLTTRAEELPAGHAGFLIGRYRNGSTSDEWTDVSRCAEGTFVAYAPACSCGWTGPLQPATPAGRLLSSRIWQDDHLSRLRLTAMAS